MKYKKGFVGAWIAFLVAGALAIAGGSYYLGKTSNPISDNSFPEEIPDDFFTDTTKDETKKDDCKKTDAPWIKVLSPSGGETYTAGQKIEVKWTSCNIKNVWLNLASGGKDFGEITYPNPVSASQGSYQWTASNPARAFTQSNTNSYQIGIESQSPNVLVKSGTFKVNTPTSMSCNNIEFIPPKSGILDQKIEITSSLIATLWHYTGSKYGIDKSFEYGVFECKNNAWDQVYISGLSELEDQIVLSLLPHQSILVVKGFAGAGTMADWEVLYTDGSSWMVKLGNTIRDQALAQAGLVFAGYNGVSVLNGNIVETLPGYKKDDPRCCPSSQGKMATYSWSGSSLDILSVENFYR